MWTLYLPFIQPCSPASLATRTLHAVLGKRIADYTYVDFAAGAGGPTPYLEAELNAQLAVHATDAGGTTGTVGNARTAENLGEQPKSVDFVLTDIAPHVPAWRAAAQKSPHLHYVSKPVDATNAPLDLLDHVNLSEEFPKRQIFRLFSLAFHHFPDPLAKAVLANTLETSSGFAIFELQARTLSSVLLITLMGPLLLLVTPICFWNDPVQLIFTYLVPIVPFVLVFDGYVSSLRTRTGEEVMQMIDSLGPSASEDWEFSWGTKWHTRPIGDMTWFVGTKNSKSRVS